MSGVESITVRDDEGDLRLDRWFRRRFPGLGHGRLERLLRTGQVRVDGRRAKSSTRLAPGQSVRVPPMDPAEGAAAPPRPRLALSEAEVQSLRASVLYEDDWVIALNKPPGLAVQGGTGQTRHLDAMLGALAAGGEAPRLVHRLDRDTSGVLLLARSASAAGRLAAHFKNRDAQKIYWALVVGAPAEKRGRIDRALSKVPGRGGEIMGPDAGEAAKPAETLYRVIETRRGAGRGDSPLTWLVLLPLTGRTHQLRAHCALLGTPILGDGKYGGRSAHVEGAGGAGGAGGLPKRLMLHAREIAVPHPDDGTTLRATAPLSPHMEAAWRALGFDARKGERGARELLDYAEGLAHSPPGTMPKPKRASRKTGGKASRKPKRRA